MPEATTQHWRTAHLPEQPGQALGTTAEYPANKGANFFRKVNRIEPDSNTRCGESCSGVQPAGILEGWDFNSTRPLPKLLAFIDAGSETHHIRPPRPEREQLFEHDGDLDAVRCGQRIKLKGALPYGQNAVVCVGPAIGRLMIGNLPPPFLVPVHTFGGTYVSAVMLIPLSNWHRGADISLEA